MADLNTKRRHDLYEEWEEVASYLWKSYVGGKAYKEAALDQHPRETADVHGARQERSYYLNHYAGVIDAYVSAVYRRDPVREPEETASQNGTQAPPGSGARFPSGAFSTQTQLGQGFERFIDDATGDGTTLNAFCRDVATFALAAQRAFVGVDIASDGFPYTHLIHPANLLDYSEGDKGVLNWAIVAEVEIEDEDPFSERVSAERFRLWLPGEWVLFNDSGAEIDRGPNSAGVVPIIGVSGDSVRLPVYDIATINQRIFNLCSQLDEILIGATFPQRYAPGDGVEDETGESISPDVSPIAVGVSRLMLIPNDASIPPGFLSPPDEPARVHMDEREKLVTAIRSLAGLERRDPDAVSPQSGVAKAYDFRETNERLVSLAQMMEEFEVEVFDLLSAYGVAGTLNVTYNKDFNIKDQQMMVETYETLAPLPLPAIAKKRAALDLSMAIAEEATEEEKKEIREAVENMTDADFNPTPPSPIEQILNRRSGASGAREPGVLPNGTPPLQTQRTRGGE